MKTLLFCIAATMLIYPVFSIAEAWMERRERRRVKKILDAATTDREGQQE